MDIATLKAQHAEIEALAKGLLGAVAEEERSLVATLRWRLARAVIAHLAVEDRYLYPALIGGKDAAAASTAKRFQTEMGGLAGRFLAYMTGWPDHAVIENWSDFRVESVALLNDVLQRVARENAELYTLAGLDETLSSPCSRSAA